MEAATKALLYLFPGFLLAELQKVSRASTANLTLLSKSDSPSSIDSPLDANPGSVAYNYRIIYKKTIGKHFKGITCMKYEEPKAERFSIPNVMTSPLV